MRFRIAVVLALASMSVLAAEYDTAPKVTAGLQQILADKTSLASYCEMQKTNAAATAAYKAGDQKRSVELTQKGTKLAAGLPAYKGYMGVSMKNAMNSTFFTTPEGVAMNKALDALTNACFPKNP